MTEEYNYGDICPECGGLEFIEKFEGTATTRVAGNGKIESCEVDDVGPTIKLTCLDCGETVMER